MANSSLQAQLQEVLDREAIRTLPQRYCHCVWQKDLDGYAALFTEDGTFGTDDPSLPRGQGRQQLRGLIEGALNDLGPRPFIHNHVIELTGPDSATGTCYVEVHLLKEGKKWEMRGWYNDEYAKVGGEWKFKSRQITTDSFGPENEG